MRFVNPRSIRAVTVALSAILAAPAVGVTALAAFAPAAEARPAPESFADLAERLLPAVVNISSSQTVAAHGDRPGAGPEIPKKPRCWNGLWHNYR